MRQARGTIPPSSMTLSNETGKIPVKTQDYSWTVMLWSNRYFCEGSHTLDCVGGITWGLVHMRYKNRLTNTQRSYLWTALLPYRCKNSATREMTIPTDGMWQLVTRDKLDYPVYLATNIQPLLTLCTGLDSWTTVSITTHKGETQSCQLSLSCLPWMLGNKWYRESAASCYVIRDVAFFAG